MHISLTPKLEQLVHEKVEAGLYNNASEVVREALRLMQEYDALQRLKLERLRGLIAEGRADVASGRFTEIATDEDLDAFFAKL